MKHFDYLKQLIKDAIDDETYNEVEIEGETFKEIILDDNINCDNTMENRKGITLNEDNIIIDGAGHCITLNHNTRVFEVACKNVIIRNFNFKNGKTFGDGGIIHNSGVVKIENCTFKGCEASSGGAIYNKGVLVVSDSSFEDNTATSNFGKGGAICNVHLSMIFNSRFLKNHSDDYGGAIFNGKTLMVDGCFFKRNTARIYGETIKNKGFFSFMDALNVSSEGLDVIAGRTCSITNSTFEDSKHLIRTSSDLNIKNCVFKNSKKILSIHSSMINITDCLFENNCSYLIENTYSTVIHSDVCIKNCDFINNRSKILPEQKNNPYGKTYLFNIKNDRKHWTVENCHFENNAANYIFQCNSADITFENASFEGNDFESIVIFTTSTYDNENGKLKLKNVSFKEKSEDIISCEENLEIDNCRFQKHHRINNESVFDIYQSEKKFIDRLNGN